MKRTLLPPVFCVLLGVGRAQEPAVQAAPVRVYLDAGHGAQGNSGNDDAWCRDEQDVMLDVAGAVADGLRATARYDVMVSRALGERVAYPDRLAAARTFGAQAFISLHSDARGMGVLTERPGLGVSCPVNASEPGFAVLWSDEGNLAAARLDLARALALALSEAGFMAYDGVNYGGLYQADLLVDGVFVDRHVPRQRIMMLRRPVMPSVIIETHHAWHPIEAMAWQQDDVRARFAAALDAGLQAWVVEGAGEP